MCSLHFLTADFRKDCEKWLLKPGAVPSVFDEQGLHAAHVEAAKQGEERARKRKRECSPNVSVPDTLFTCTSEPDCETTVADIADQRASTEKSPSAKTNDGPPERVEYSEELLLRASALPLDRQDQGSVCGTQDAIACDMKASFQGLKSM